MKILVTGATGTVGSEVVKALRQRGAEIQALTRKRPESVKLSGAVEITLGDLSDPVSVAQAMEGEDKLFLLIGNVADEFTQALTAYGLATLPISRNSLSTPTIACATETGSLRSPKVISTAPDNLTDSGRLRVSACISAPR